MASSRRVEMKDMIWPRRNEGLWTEQSTNSPGQQTLGFKNFNRQFQLGPRYDSIQSWLHPLFCFSLMHLGRNAPHLRKRWSREKNSDNDNGIYNFVRMSDDSSYSSALPNSWTFIFNFQDRSVQWCFMVFRSKVLCLPCALSLWRSSMCPQAGHALVVIWWKIQALHCYFLSPSKTNEIYWNITITAKTLVNADGLQAQLCCLDSTCSWMHWETCFNSLTYFLHSLRVYDPVTSCSFFEHLRDGRLPEIKNHESQSSQFTISKSQTS